MNAPLPGLGNLLDGKFKHGFVYDARGFVYDPSWTLISKTLAPRSDLPQDTGLRYPSHDRRDLDRSRLKLAIVVAPKLRIVYNLSIYFVHPKAYL